MRWTERSKWQSLMRQRNQDIDIVDGEETRLAVDHPLIPVIINLIGQRDDVTFLKAQLTLVLWLKVIQSATAWLIQRSYRAGGEEMV